MFVRNVDVSIESERLVVGPPRPASQEPLPITTIPFHVECELRSTSAKLVNGHIGFPLPACSLGDYVWAKHSTFITGSAGTCAKEPKMTLTVDGSTTAGKWGFAFLLDGSPLSDRSSDAELAQRISGLINLVRDPDEKFFQEDPVYLSAARTLCLRLGGRIDKGECAAFGRVMVHRTFIWDHVFQPGTTVHVVHDYQVNASWNLHPDDVFKSDAFCLGDPSVHASWTAYLDNYKKQEASYTSGRGGEFEYPREFFTEYVLKTGALWAGPIKDFELIIRKSEAGELVSTCFSGLAKTSPVEFRVHRVNFVPSEELRILYLPPAPRAAKRQ